MWKALQLTGGPEVEETVRFISFFDRFFDCFNVSSYSAGRKQRKVFKQPYRSPADFRLKVEKPCIIMWVQVHIVTTCFTVLNIYSG